MRYYDGFADLRVHIRPLPRPRPQRMIRALRKEPGRVLLAVAGLAMRDRDSHGGVVPFALFTAIGVAPFLAAEALYRPAERFGLGALCAPFEPPVFVVGPRVIKQRRLLPERVAQAPEERAIVLQFDRVHRAAVFGGIAYVLVAV